MTRMTRRSGGFAVLAIVAALSLVANPGGGRPVVADEWNDPLETAVRVFLERREAARDGRSDEAWVTRRADEVTVFSDLARVDVSLAVTNARAAGTRGLEWRRTLPIDPRAELIGATYRRPDGLQTAGRTLKAFDARRLYRDATSPRYGQDPMTIERVERDLLDVAIFPVAPGATATLSLSFVTPLDGKGEERVYRDPLGVRARRAVAPAAPAPSDEPGATAEAPRTPLSPDVVARFPERLRNLLSLTAVVREDQARPPPAATVPPTDVLVRFRGVLPETPPVGCAWVPVEGGALRLAASGEGRPGEVPPLPVRVAGRSVAGCSGPVPTFAVGYFGSSYAFAWRVDAAEALKELGVEETAGASLLVKGVFGASARIAPDTVAADAGPTLVMGRSSTSKRVRLELEAVDADGKVLARGERRLDAERVTLAEPVADALRAWHRARLADRVHAWAGDRTDRQSLALGYSVTLGVLRAGTAVLAVPEDERGFMSRIDERLYLTQGAPFDGDLPVGEDPTPPGTSVR